MFRDISATILNLLFPPTCILCKKYLAPSDRLFQLCLPCRETLEPNRPPFCQKCSRPLHNVTRTHCRTCEETLPQFDRAWGCLIYNDSAKKLLHLYKYAGKTSLRLFFSRWAIQFYENYRIPLSHLDVIIPIPLHPTRQRERGYNQAHLLANEFGKSLNLPVLPQTIFRRRHTATQTTLSQKERWTNISGAFKIKQPFNLQGKNILLIDDLYTTGATCSEVAMLLKNAGAKQVLVLTVAIVRMEKEF